MARKQHSAGKIKGKLREAVTALTLHKLILNEATSGDH